MDRAQQFEGHAVERETQADIGHGRRIGTADEALVVDGVDAVHRGLHQPVRLRIGLRGGHCLRELERERLVVGELRGRVGKRLVPHALDGRAFEGRRRRRRRLTKVVVMLAALAGADIGLCATGLRPRGRHRARWLRRARRASPWRADRRFWRRADAPLTRNGRAFSGCAGS